MRWKRGGMSKYLDCWRDVASIFFWQEQQSVERHPEKFWPVKLFADKPSLPGKTGGEIMRWYTTSWIRRTKKTSRWARAKEERHQNNRKPFSRKKTHFWQKKPFRGIVNFKCYVPHYFFQKKLTNREQPFLTTFSVFKYKALYYTNGPFWTARNHNIANVTQNKYSKPWCDKNFKK